MHARAHVRVRVCVCVKLNCSILPLERECLCWMSAYGEAISYVFGHLFSFIATLFRLIFTTCFLLSESSLCSTSCVAGEASGFLM